MSNRTLLACFDEWRRADSALVLATVVHTAGSTYSKAGRQILIRASGQHAGLVSGGCLEGDLAEHAREILCTGTPKVVTYDMRTEADDLWGMGLGCNGLLSILLQRLTAADNWQPFAELAAAMAAPETYIAALSVTSTLATLPSGTLFIRGSNGTWTSAPPPNFSMPNELPATTTIRQSDGVCELLCWTLHPWPRLLLLGAGPDTVPLLELARTLGWQASVADHRPHYIAALPAGLAERAHVIVPGELQQQLQLGEYSAVVVMSHHLESDRQYLRELSGHRHPYVGLLGPSARKARLLDELGLTGSEFARRLRGPVGLAIGADTPATIALAILGEIQAQLPAQRQSATGNA